MSDDKYPRGKVRSDDEGATQMAIGIRNGTIYLAFKKPILWLGFGAHEARALAAKLNELADGLEQ